MSLLQEARSAIEALRPVEICGQVQAARGPLIEATGLGGLALVGSCCAIARPGRPDLTGEIIGFCAGATLLLLHSEPHGVAPGALVRLIRQADPRPCASWLGRVVDAFGRPLDEAVRGPLLGGETAYALKGRPPAAFARRRVGARIETGIKGLDTLLPLCRGQRLGIFAGSGVGKSSLLAMLARHVAVDVIVIGLIGERGKEVNEFLEDTLGPDGMARAVTIIATSDEPPLVKRQAARLTLTVAEFFRDQGQQVLCLFDFDHPLCRGPARDRPRVGRAAHNAGLSAVDLRRDVGPARAGRPGAAQRFARRHHRGVHGARPGRRHGRAGGGCRARDPGRPRDPGSIDRGARPVPTDRRAQERVAGAAACHSAAENALALATRKVIADYETMATMIRIGAYRPGSDAETDRAIQLRPELEDFLAQPLAERASQTDSFAELGRIIAIDAGDDPAA